MKLNLGEIFQVFYEPNIYSSFPDISFFDEKYYCVFRTGDSHHPLSSNVVISTSDDGVYWLSEVLLSSDLEKDGYVFNCPRINAFDVPWIVCDCKSSTKEGEAEWKTLLWKFGEDTPLDLKIDGMVPDKIIPVRNKLIMGYHVVEKIDNKSQFSQMISESYDGGKTWRDRTTVSTRPEYNLCEGSIVNLDNLKLICFMRDNRSVNASSLVSVSPDAGKTWSSPKQVGFCGHRIVAGVKKNEPYAGAIIGTFRNTVNKTLSLFIQNPISNKLQIFALDTESNFNMFNFGYSGWVENADGSLQVVYYIQRNKPNPEIVTMRVEFY